MVSKAATRAVSLAMIALALTAPAAHPLFVPDGSAGEAADPVPGGAISMQAVLDDYDRRSPLKGSYDGALTHLLSLADHELPLDATTATEILDAAFRLQAQRLGVVLAPAAAPRHGLPSQAALALLGSFGVLPTGEQQAAILGLDLRPAEPRAALTQLLDAFLGLEQATRAAFAEADLAALTDLRSGTAASARDAFREDSLTRAGVDVGRLLGARAAFVAAAMEFAHAWNPHLGTASPGPGVDLCPVLALDLVGEDTTYAADCALIVDVGGDDVYWNNAGGTAVNSGCDATPGAAALVDLDGNDTYGDPAAPRECGANGGGEFGVGVLIDVAGSDVYTAKGHGTNGGGSTGVGLLLDLGASDRYNATTNGANGGGFGGLGMLLDLSGWDTYVAGNVGTNGGGSTGGHGFLFDQSGWDNYTAGGFGTNGGGDLGVGFLLDASGWDTYSAGIFGTNGGANFGVGLLIDVSGPDTYTAGSSGVNGGATIGLGLLLDAGGSDTYSDQSGGSGTDVTVVPKGLVGAQVDVGVVP